MSDCPICQAMRQGLASYEAQMICGHCPACCACQGAEKAASQDALEGALPGPQVIYYLTF